MAEASGAIILGFHIRPNSKAKELAKEKKIEIRMYSIIYNLVDDIKNALEGMLKPLITEELLATQDSITETTEVIDTIKVVTMFNTPEADDPWG